MQNNKIYKIKGMHCASCAGIIEKTLSKTGGVTSASANYGNESVHLLFDESTVSPSELSKKIEPLGYSLVLEEDSKNKNENATEILKIKSTNFGLKFVRTKFN